VDQSQGGIITHKKVSNKKEKTGKTGWDFAIEQAEIELYKAKARKSRIIKAILFFKEQIKNGTPWPDN
jgi:hypothetical protein